jgi:hypothetical protein
VSAPEPGAKGPPAAPLRRGSAWGGVVLSLLPSLILPLVIFYVLGALGQGVIPAALLAGVPPLAVTLLGLIRRRRPDRLALFTLVLFLVQVALTAALFLVLGASTLNGLSRSGLARFVLARGGLTTALAGCLMLGSLLRRPLILELMRSHAERLGLGSALERRWSADPVLQHGMRVVTAVWGVGLLGDAAVRVLMALLLPVRLVPLAQGLQYLVAFCLLLGFQFLYMRTRGLLLSSSAVSVGGAR